MTKIETNQLLLIALDLEHLKLLKQDRILLEKHLEIEFSDHQLSSETKYEIVNDLTYRLVDVSENPEQYEWFTSWEIILKERNQSIGSVAFSGFPDNDESLALSYYVDERFRNMGYATEALMAITKWAFNNKKILQISAETTSWNHSSNKVLKKCGFSIIDSANELISWELRQ